MLKIFMMLDKLEMSLAVKSVFHTLFLEVIYRDFVIPFFSYLNTTQLVCNCKLSWLPAWLVGQEFKDYVHAVCLHPTHLERRSIFNLTSSDFICGKKYYQFCCSG